MSAATELRRRAHGLSMVELMVGLVVGLLVSLTAASSAQLFTALQRQGVGVGGGSVNAASVLAAIKADAANAGLGFFGNSNYLCATLNLGVGSATVSDGASFAPVQATRSGSSDRLDVVYGSEIAAGAAVKLASASTGSTATLNSLLPASVGQAVLLAPTTTANPCVVRSVTAVTASTSETKQVLAFDSTGNYNQAAFTTNPTYAEKSTVALLGTLRWTRYAVDSGNLTVTNMLDGSSAILLRNVMTFRVEYGTSSSTSGSTTLDSWQDPADTGWTAISSSNIARVRALRLGVVVRSPQREKVNAQTGDCEASSTKPVLFDNTIEPDVTDWKCYRYRSVTLVAPLRNIVYGLK